MVGSDGELAHQFVAMASVERLYRLKRKYHLDPDTLHCPICTDPLSPPVFQCPNGHAACSSCCKKIRKGICPSCSKPIGNNRNIAVEKIIDSLQVSCKYAHMGCTEMQKYAKRKEHEQRCGFRPCPCPVSGCLFESARGTLARHIAEKHDVEVVQRGVGNRSTTFTMNTSDLFVIVEGDQGVFLVHHEDRKLVGDAFLCTAFTAPGTSYYLTVQLESEAKFFAMETFTHDIQREAEWKHDFLLVPHKPNSQVIRQFNVELWLTDQDSADNYGSDDYCSE